MFQSLRIKSRFSQRTRSQNLVHDLSGGNSLAVQNSIKKYRSLLTSNFETKIDCKFKLFEYGVPFKINWDLGGGRLLEK